MIVRNESAILERCLRSVLPQLSCYIVCDTGSTDHTVEIIKRSLKDIPGEIHSTTFQDFGQARNEALELARGSSLEFDYLLLIDADMELVVGHARWRETLSHPAYLVRQVSGGTAYHNVRLLARDAAARYVGATHEYLDLEVPALPHHGVTMIDHACGSSRTEKTERDLALLTSSLEENPDDPRSLFYLAQTLREAGRHAEAIACYERRIELGGWEEEVWYSQFMIARCRQDLGDSPGFVNACLKAYQMRPSRAEPLHALVQHYRCQGLNEVANLLCEAGARIPLPEDLLFLQEDVYRTGFRHEFSITGYYSPLPTRRALARKFCAELAVERGCSAQIRENVRSNWRFYARSAGELFGSVQFVSLQHPLPQGYNPCNPSLALKEGTLWCVLRSVNYTMVNGAYLVAGDGTIHTQNYLLELDDSLQPRSSVPIVEANPELAQDPAITGLEDVRLFHHGSGFRASATVADRNPDWLRQMAVFDLTVEGRVEHLTIQNYGSEQHQKNWVPLVDDGSIGFIYWTDPTIVLQWDEKSRQSAVRFQHTCPFALEHLRGSSGAVPFDGGWLYVTHEVSYPGNQRTYLHRFVFLDRTFRVQALSEPFYFRWLGVEFCCGLAPGPEKGQLVASFGVEDREAWLAVLEAEEVRRALCSPGNPGS